MSEWFISRWSLEHHLGTFFISSTSAHGDYHTSIVCNDASREGGLRCDVIGTFPTLEDAQAAVASRIATLDAIMPVAESEQLEACR